jgi:hypothetical protein
MKHTFLVFIFGLITLGMGLNSCDDDGKCGEVNISEAGSTDSHNNGQNCLTCHQSGGKGEGCFSIAGSVYAANLSTPLAAGTVKLFSGPNGTGQLMHSIAIDANGNFHTTEPIDYTGLYAAVTGPSGMTRYMGTQLTNGACNSCHGASATKLWGE